MTVNDLLLYIVSYVVTKARIRTFSNSPAYPPASPSTSTSSSSTPSATPTLNPSGYETRSETRQAYLEKTLPPSITISLPVMFGHPSTESRISDSTTLFACLFKKILSLLSIFSCSSEDPIASTFTFPMTSAQSSSFTTTTSLPSHDNFSDAHSHLHHMQYHHGNRIGMLPVTVPIPSLASRPSPPSVGLTTQLPSMATPATSTPKPSPPWRISASSPCLSSQLSIFVWTVTAARSVLRAITKRMSAVKHSGKLVNAWLHYGKPPIVVLLIRVFLSSFMSHHPPNSMLLYFALHLITLDKSASLYSYFIKFQVKH